MKRIRVFHGLVCAAMLLAVTGALHAQEFRATIKGQVTDSSQAALPGATVSVRNQETNEVATATTNAEGNYTIPFLRPGIYTLTVELSGFQKYTRSDMRLEVSQVAQVNAQLGVGGVTESVNVSAESPLLETSKADRGTVIDQARIAELPLQSRSPMALATLIAGVTYNAQAIYLRPFDNGALADWSMNGGQNRNNEFLLDGAPNNANQSGNNIAYVPPADAVQEFKMQTNSYDAQYGRTAGGVMNMSLKSGTNSLHGTAYEYYRRKWLDANSFLLNARSTPKVEHYLDQYGFEIDGPVVIPGLYNGHSKTFFMFNGEKYREGTPAAQFSSVPTPAMKTGDFSGLVDAQGRPIIIYDPATGRDVNGEWTRDPFPGNKIPADRISPVARALLQYYPDPNCTTPGQPNWQQNLCYNEHFNKDKFWNWVGKVDHNFSQNDRVFFRYGKNKRNEVRNTTAIRSGPAQNGQLPLDRHNDAVVGDWVHILGGGTVFNLRSSFTYYFEGSQGTPSFGFDATSLGWPASLVSQFPAARVGGLFPVVNMDDFVTLSRGFGPNENKIYTIQPNITLTRGNHNVRSGLDTRFTNVYNTNYGNAGGQLDFSRSTFTRSTLNTTSTREGNAFAAFLLGAPSGGNVPVNLFPHYLWTFVAPWVQDDWRVSSRLTVNLGFRWDFNSPVHEQEDRLNYIFDRTIQNPISSKVGQPVMGGLTFLNTNGTPNTPYKYDKNNYQARGGMAYQINEKTVLRAGYGKYFLNPTGQGQTQGFSLATQLISSNDNNRTPIPNILSNPYPNGIQQPPGSSLGPLTNLGRVLTFVNPDFVTPSVHQFSIGIERELPWKVALEASYVGSRSYDVQGNISNNPGGINEPSAEFQKQCDVTQGGSRTFCDTLVTNPYFNVPGFEGTTRFTSEKLSNYELARPYNAFDRINQTENNLGRMWYDSLQLVANKRWSKGVTMAVNYTWVPRWTEDGANTGTGIGNAYVDDVSKLKNHGPYFSQRKHRVTASGVWQMGGQNRKDVIGYVLGGWSIAPMFVFQSGQPWDMPGSVDLAPGVALKDIALDGKKEGQFIYGVKPCVGTYNTNTGKYDLQSYSVAYGCTQPYFLVRQMYQRRTAMFRYDEFRRPIYWEIDASLSKMIRITDKTRFQMRFEAFNLLNSPMYDERGYETSTTSADFGRINRNVTGQSNFQRAFQLGFKFIY